MEAQNGHTEIRDAVNISTEESTSVEIPEVSGRRPLADILDDLQKPIPQRLLQTKRLNNQEITFVPWHRAQKILNHYTHGFWEYEIVERTFTEKRIMLTVRIIVHAAEGIFHREGTGIENLDVENYGDPQSNAESQAFRRACARWGLGIHLYEN